MCAYHALAITSVQHADEEPTNAQAVSPAIGASDPSAGPPGMSELAVSSQACTPASWEEFAGSESDSAVYWEATTRTGLTFSLSSD